MAEIRIRAYRVWFALLVLLISLPAVAFAAPAEALPTGLTHNYDHALRGYDTSGNLARSGCTLNVPGTASLIRAAGAPKQPGAFSARLLAPQPTRRALATSCRANSFVPATLVLMADGTTKRIADVEVGDMVMATDPETGERGPRRVTDTIVGDGIKQLVDIEVDGEVITATDGHPFWVDDEGRWVDAEDLKPGDVLLLADGETVTVDAVAERSEVRRVHNLTVDGIHTYYVLAGDDPVLVHNCAQPSSFRDLMDPAEATRYDAYWSRYAPDQVQPGITRLDHIRSSARTGRTEQSRVIYDEFGRQRWRIDFTDHMRPGSHTSPHLHQYDYGPGFSPTGRGTQYDF